MRKYLLLITIYYIIIANVNAQVYRWDTKILIDTSGLRIYSIKAEKETISNLASNTSTPRPDAGELKNGKRAEAEKRKVTVTAYIIETGAEEDGDYHLVLKDLTNNKTLIGEIPDPATSKLKGFPGLKGDFTKARQEVNDKIGTPPSRVTKLPQKIKVKITGFVFFDKMAHGNGHAINGVEIHPILSIKVVQ
jgi:hypothetical protein